MKQGPETGSCTTKESNDASNDATTFFQLCDFDSTGRKKKLKMYQEGGEFCQLSSMITTTYRVYSNFSASG